MMFDSVLEKIGQALRSAKMGLIRNIAQKVECTLVYNQQAVAYPRGTIVSFYGQTDLANMVRDTDENGALPPDTNCKEQYVGVLEAPLAAGTVGAPTVALARHDGLAYTLMIIGLDPHVGDSVWASRGEGQLIGTVGPTPIYVGMIRDLGDYDTAAPTGTTGVNVLLKHDAPSAGRPE